MRYGMMTIVALLGFFALLGGCRVTERYGDARIKYWLISPYLKATMDELRLPDFSISEPATYRFKVRNLPVCVYPKGLAVHDKGDDGFRKAKIAVSLLSTDGKLIWEGQADLSDQTASRSSYQVGVPQVSYRLAGNDQSKCQAEHRSYDIVVTVLTPSSHPGDKAFLGAGFYRGH